MPALIPQKPPSEELTNLGLSKVDVFKWKQLDNPGDFQWIPKTLLNVDHSYQRNGSHVSRTRVMSIAQNWSWLKLGVLLVCRRKDMTFWVYDGQHRKLAADKRLDVTVLPCLVFPSELISTEADAFFGANTLRGAMDRITKFNAQIVAGDKHALGVRDMMAKYGYEAGEGSFKIRCIGRVLADYAVDPDVADKVFGLCAEMFQGEPITERVFGGLCFLERFVAKHKSGSIFDAHNYEAITRLGPRKLEEEIDRAKAYYAGGGGAKVWAAGIVNALNYKRRSRQLPMIPIKGDEK